MDRTYISHTRLPHLDRTYISHTRLPHMPCVRMPRVEGVEDKGVEDNLCCPFYRKPCTPTWDVCGP